MQNPSVVSLSWREGRTNDFPFALYSDATHATPIDITGVRWIMELRTGGTLLLRKDSAVNGDMTIVAMSGSVTVHFPPAGTLGVSWRDVQYELIGIWPVSGPTLSYFIGAVKLAEAVASVT